MSIDFEIFDNIDRFTVIDASCLWVEVEPSKPVKSDLPDIVQAALLMIAQEAAKYTNPKRELRESLDPQSLSSSRSHEFKHPRDQIFPPPARDNDIVYRWQLEEIARDRGIKPKFLFKETRDKASKPSMESQLDVREKSSLLKMLAGEYHDQGIDLTEKSLAKRLVGKVERAGYSLSQTKVREIIKDIYYMNAVNEKTQ